MADICRENDTFYSVTSAVVCLRDESCFLLVWGHGKRTITEGHPFFLSLKLVSSSIHSSANSFSFPLVFLLSVWQVESWFILFSGGEGDLISTTANNSVFFFTYSCSLVVRDYPQVGLSGGKNRREHETNVENVPHHAHPQCITPQINMCNISECTNWIYEQ